MKRKKVFLTGATGSMGKATLSALTKDAIFEVITLVRDTEEDRKIIKPFVKYDNLTIHFGDLTVYQDVLDCMTGVDVVLHCAALVSPLADAHPKLAMAVNYGGTLNLIQAIKEQPNADEIRFVFIGTVAETGDRMPPIHWGRVGDPIKPSVHDYYAVSKIAAERAVIESGLKYWVSMRQTGILSDKMAKINDPIIFHNPLDNVLEYVTDHDSGVLMRNCCEDLPDAFWGHIYNIGGGPSCRMSCYELFCDMFRPLGFKNLDTIIDAKWFALRNFHGQYYLDSDKLEHFLKFRSQDKTYFYNLYLKNMGLLVPICKIVNQFPGGPILMGNIIRRRFKKLLLAPRGTQYWLNNHLQDFIEPFFISEKKWAEIPRLDVLEHFVDWEQVMPIHHGYDENKAASELTLEDVKQAAIFRGGTCLSESMNKGDWTTQLEWSCAFGHTFKASLRLVLEGGHWCETCETESWNYHEIAKVSPFFAQVWYPLHDVDEVSRVYDKLSALE